MCNKAARRSASPRCSPGSPAEVTPAKSPAGSRGIGPSAEGPVWSTRPDFGRALDATSVEVTPAKSPAERGPSFSWFSAASSAVVTPAKSPAGKGGPCGTFSAEPLVEVTPARSPAGCGEQFSDVLGSRGSCPCRRGRAVGREVGSPERAALETSAAGAASHRLRFSPRPPPLGLESTGGV